MLRSRLKTDHESKHLPVSFDSQLLQSFGPQHKTRTLANARARTTGGVELLRVSLQTALGPGCKYGRRALLLLRRVLRCTLRLQLLRVENAVATVFSLDQRLRIVFEGIRRRFRSLIFHRQDSAPFRQVEFNLRSMSLDRARLNSSSHSQPNGVRLAAHLAEFLNGFVITLSLLHSR